MMDFSRGLENKGHVIVVDNFFTSVQLFLELRHKGIYATDTMQSKCIGLHLSMKNLKAFKKCPHGELD